MVDDATIDNAIKTSQATLDPLTPLYACGCCRESKPRGDAATPADQACPLIPLTQLTQLRLTDAQLERYLNYSPAVRVDAVTWVKLPGDDHETYFHLHRLFVQMVSNVPSIRICEPACWSSLKAGAVPKICIASGYDWGHPQYCDPPLPEPTRMEIALLSTYRLYAKIYLIDVKWNKTTNQFALRGHMCAVPTDAAHATRAAVRSMQNIYQNFTVVFLGTKDQYIRCAHEVLGLVKRDLTVRPDGREHSGYYYHTD